MTQFASTFRPNSANFRQIKKQINLLTGSKQTSKANTKNCMGPPEQQEDELLWMCWPHRRENAVSGSGMVSRDLDFEDISIRICLWNSAQII